MTKACFLLLLAALDSPAIGQEAVSLQPEIMAKAMTQLVPPEADKCRSPDPAEVVVCGRLKQRYRIDPDVLAATRAVEALPPKPELDASKQSSCVGPNCGGGTIPLVGMALAALKAAELASEGDDWRDAFRTHPDSYKVYQDARSREKRGSITIGIGAGNKAAPR